MKRILMVGCAAVAVAATFSTFAAKTWTDESGAVWTYSASRTGVSIRGYASPEGNVVIPQTIEGRSVVGIYTKAFMNCPWIRSVVLPDSVRSIGSSAFANCAWLESVTFPSGKFTIGSRAFEGCVRLAELKNDAAIASVGFKAFSGCASLGEGVVILGGRVLFVNGVCPAEVVIPDGTVGIVGGAFKNCAALQTVHIPKSLQSVGTSAFDGCSALKEFIVDPANPYFQSANGMLVSRTGRRVICGVNGDALIPDGIVEIGDYAFSGFENLASVMIPNGVTNIGAYAFQNCRALTHIDIPASVVSVGVNAFDGCDGLDNVDVYSVGEFNGAAKHMYTGVVIIIKDGTGYERTVGIVQLATAKATARGVRVSGAIMLDDGKKYPIRSAQGTIENGVLKVETSVSQLGNMSLVVGLNGFKGNVGADYLVRSEDTSGYSTLKGTITKTSLDAATGRFKTGRVTLTGFSEGNSATGVAQERGKDELSFAAVVE